MVQPPTPLNAAQREAAQAWLREQIAKAPEEVRPAAEYLVELLSQETSAASRKRRWTELGRALGILPSSEKRRSSRPTGGGRGGSKPKPRNEREYWQQQLEQCNSAVERASTSFQKNTDKVAKIQTMLASLGDEETQVALDINENTPADEIELSPEAEARHQAETEATMERVKKGVFDGPEETLEPASETLMNGSVVSTYEESVRLPAHLPEGVEEKDVVETLYQDRVRYDLSLSVTQLNLEVEKKIVEDADGRRRVYSGSTRAFGPSRWSITWNALATLAILVGQFAMPLNRLSTMLSTSVKRFSSASLGRMIHYVAERFLPIYLVLVDQLADSSILAGDDTPTRVIEVSQYLQNNGNQSQEPTPWSSYATAEAASASYEQTVSEVERIFLARMSGDRNAQRATVKEPSLCVKTSCELGFAWSRQDGSGEKRSFNTTVVTGRSDADDPRSLIILYRSHLGSFGNLLTVLLQRRKKRLRELTVQSDLSTTNLVTDSSLMSHFAIQWAGCGSHARRPFALHEQDDPLYGPLMLSAFEVVATHEQVLSQVGRNRENVLAVRGNDSRKVWENIKEIALQMKKKWSHSTPLGAGARYILKHFKRLTAYLTNPHLEWTNNLRERLLRMEKLIQKNSLFRRTIEGRVVLDIIRSVLQTAVAADVPVQEYLVDVLRADPADIERDPEHFTPLAWAKRHTNESYSDTAA